MQTFLVPVEEDALGFEDEDDVFWVGPVHDAGRLGAQKLIGLVHLLKHVLSRKSKRFPSVSPKPDSHRSAIIRLYPTDKIVFFNRVC